MDGYTCLRIKIENKPEVMQPGRHLLLKIKVMRVQIPLSGLHPAVPQEGKRVTQT
jgi:hypothetical protein